MAHESTDRKITIAVSEQVHDKLRALGQMGDTFDLVLRRVLGMKK